MKDLPQWLKHATVWLLVLLGGVLAVMAWQRHAESTRFVIEGQALEIRRSADGHYHWRGTLAGQPVEFLVDTGATATAIPLALAQRLGLPVVGSVQSMTAGGLVTGSIVVADLALEGGVRAERLRIAALPRLTAPLLGMDVLGRLQWRQSEGVLRVDLKGST